MCGVGHVHGGRLPCDAMAPSPEREAADPDWIRQYKEMASGPHTDTPSVRRTLPAYLDDEAEKQPIPSPWQQVIQANLSTDSVTSSEALEREQDRLALQEWDEGVRQLQMAFQLVLIPFFGRWIGRRWSYWCTSSVSHTVFARYLQG